MVKVAEDYWGFVLFEGGFAGLGWHGACSFFGVIGGGCGGVVWFVYDSRIRKCNFIECFYILDSLYKSSIWKNSMYNHLLVSIATK